MDDAAQRPRAPYGGRTREEYADLLREKLTPPSLRFTLAFAGLFQLTHELLKSAILDKVREYYWRGFDGSTQLYDEDAYTRDVLEPSLQGGRPNRFRGSVAWLVRAEAITSTEADRLQSIYSHRHELTHELGKYLVDIDKNPDLDLYVEALALLRKIQNFWAQMEIDTGGLITLEGEDIDATADAAVPLSAYLLELCIEAVDESRVSAPNAPDPSGMQERRS
ncbi:hypothetical protein PCC79_08935 [Propioniciclava soli]|uniref:Uncharacterized protein n=1 Tax=Propioniciclava soli TaxID=2775081 RepID=A0ABZ3C3C5_9ACTN